MEPRPEPRVASDLIVRIWGMDAAGHAFFQNVEAKNISSAGALLTGLDHQLKVGDIIGVQNADHKARFRVIWSIQTEPMHKTHIGVQLVDGQECPWKEKLAQPPEPSKATGKEQRRFVRHRVKFPIVMSEPRRETAPMRTSATDISGHGCYVETRIPLPFGTELELTFWIESEKVTTKAVVRASDPGVGMGIEFVGLPDDIQQRLQQLLEKQSEEPSPVGNPQISS
jgi:PilZ domain-containing protein